MQTLELAPPPAVALSTADFERVRRLIHRRAGIHLQPGKQAMVYGRLKRRLDATGAPSFAAYLDRVEHEMSGGGDGNEAQVFVNCLTTNLTSFFREAHHFEALAAELRARATRGAGPLRLWCNAASTGEEPYSLAMTLVETLGATADAQVLCTDIDTEVLAVAERGIYPADVRGLEPQRLHRHFLRGKGAHAGRVRVRPELARLLRFAPFNLVGGDWSQLAGPFDMIFCRNVMIYFDDATQRQVLQRMHGALKPGGLLFAGHSENFADARQWFRSRGQTIYERV